MNVYEKITQTIIEQIDKGIIPWQRPWTGTADGAINYVTRRPYSLLNQMLLGRPGEWLTWKQIKDRGGHLKKGSEGAMVVYSDSFVPKELRGKIDENGESEEKLIHLLKYYHVFNIEDTEGIESKMEKIPVNILQPNEMAEEIITDYVTRENIKFNNQEASNRAFYSPNTDSVTVPQIGQFAFIEEYYSTCFHELTHSTMTAKRCNRQETRGVFFGDDKYAREELVAEIGAAFLVNHCQLDSDKAFKNSVAYLQSWRNTIAKDNRLIVTAAAKAERAAKYILNIN